MLTRLTGYDSRTNPLHFQEQHHFFYFEMNGACKSHKAWATYKKFRRNIIRSNCDAQNIVWKKLTLNLGCPLNNSVIVIHNFEQWTLQLWSILIILTLYRTNFLWLMLEFHEHDCVVLTFDYIQVSLSSPIAFLSKSVSQNKLHIFKTFKQVNKNVLI